MAKRQRDEQPEREDTFEDAMAAFDAAPVPRKTWIVSTRGANVTREVVADTIEDAIREFNGSTSSFTRKQLEIVEG